MDVDLGIEAGQGSRRKNRVETNNPIVFPIRQPKGRVSIPTKEEPSKDRMDPGLQEVRCEHWACLIWDHADLVFSFLYFRLLPTCFMIFIDFSVVLDCSLSIADRQHELGLEQTGCTRRVLLRRSPRRGAGRTSRFR